MDTSRDLRIFLNHPYDDDYYPLELALTACVVFCGRAPVSAKQDSSTWLRLDKILELIRDSGHSIHDLSPRLTDDLLPRLNIAVELGLALGAQELGSRPHSILVLVDEDHEYKRYASDLAGYDFRAHGNDPHTLIREVRLRLKEMTANDLPSARRLCAEYDFFMTEVLQPLRDEEMSDRPPPSAVVTALAERARIRGWIPG